MQQHHTGQTNLRNIVDLCDNDQGLHDVRPGIREDGVCGQDGPAWSLDGVLDGAGDIELAICGTEHLKAGIGTFTTTAVVNYHVGTLVSVSDRVELALVREGLEAEVRNRTRAQIQHDKYLLVAGLQCGIKRLNLPSNPNSNAPSSEEMDTVGT